MLFISFSYLGFLKLGRGLFKLGKESNITFCLKLGKESNIMT